LSRVSGLEVDEEVHVAFVACLAASDRAEHADVARAVARAKAEDLRALLTQSFLRGHRTQHLRDWP
jgi:hypothetical protein